MRQLICIIHVRGLFWWQAGGREGVYGEAGGRGVLAVGVGVMARVDKHSRDGMHTNTQ